MGLADTLKTPPPVRRSVCAVGRLLETLPDVAPKGEVSELAALRAALVNPEWSNAALSHALAGEGHAVSHQVTQRHRAGACSCVKLGIS